MFFFFFLQRLSHFILKKHPRRFYTFITLRKEERKKDIMTNSREFQRGCIHNQISEREIKRKHKKGCMWTWLHGVFKDWSWFLT